VTQDPKHLWRAWKFAEFAVGPEGYRHTTRLAALCCMVQSQRFDGFSSVGRCVGRSCGMYRRSPIRSSSASRARCASSPTCVASGTPPTRRPLTALSASPAAGFERAPTNNQHFNVTWWLDHSSPRQSKGLVVGARRCASCSPSSLSSPPSSSSSSSLVSTRSTGGTTSAHLRCSSSPGALFFVLFADLLLSVSAADVCFGPPWPLLA
jgi:hypothetical protein